MGDEQETRTGRWFEDLPVGLVLRHALTRTVTETDNLLFCAITHNPPPLAPSSASVSSTASSPMAWWWA